MLDKDLNIMEYSDSWSKALQLKSGKILGKPFAKVNPDTPVEFLQLLLKCVSSGQPSINKNKKFTLANGTHVWYKWSISIWPDEDGNPGGLYLAYFDISNEKREEELSVKAQNVARVGGWEVDLVNNQIYWNSITRKIHEVPADYIPNLEEGINFYKAGEDREKISYLVGRAISEGIPWDENLRIITAKGNEIWVRAKGEAEMINGKAARLFGTIQDIDESKRAEIEYRTATQRLELATKGTRMGVWDFDIATSELVWDSNMYEIYGVKKDDFNGVYEAWEKTVHPEDKDRSAKEVQLAIDGGKDFDTEFRVIWPNGEIRHIRAKAFVQRDRQGNALKMTGTNWDITETKRSQEKINEITSRLAIATKASKIGIWEYNFDNREIFWDQNTYAIYELEPDTKTDLTSYWLGVVDKKDLRMIRDTMSAAIKEESDINLEIRLELPGKKTKFVKVTGHFVRDKNGWANRIIGTILDISELKNTRLELLRSEESFSGAFDNSAVGMALVDPKGRWLKVNESICQSLGYTPQELLKLSFQDITHPEDLDTDLKLLREVVKGKRESYQIEKRYYHKNGQIVHVILTVTAVHTIKNKISHFISQILDITPWRNTENQLKQLVDVTTGQNESLLNFAHIVSHNLRSHATNMTMLTNFLGGEADAAEKRNIVEMLTKASDSLNETVQHLNEVVQVKTSAKEKLTSVPLLESVKKVSNNLLAVIKESKAEYKLDITRDLKVRVVPAYLDSILLNLFTNAIKYQSPDRLLKLKIRARREADFIVIDFTDNGLGIDLERHREKLFGMYKTFHKHKDAKGIGLFITKNQVEAMDGKIEVSSEVDKGSTFTIFLKEGIDKTN